MRSIIVLTCCLALASVASADQNKHKNKQGNQVPGQQGQQVQRQQVFKAGKHSMGANNTGQLNTSNRVNLNSSKSNAFRTQSLQTGGNTHVTKNFNKNFTKTTVKNFNISKQTNVNITKVTFKPGVHIRGSQNWKGTNYVVFRTYVPVWHDRIWWISNHPRIVVIGGGCYYWDAGWWYPAWGYDPGATFVYDGPIYAYHDLDPGQVVANVQSALQAQPDPDDPEGRPYYRGEVDGLLGPLTRAALAKYQADHGLEPTASVDEPTMESLGFA